MRARAAKDPAPESTSRMRVSEQTAIVVDLEVLVDLVGSSWRTTRQEVALVAAELAELRQLAAEARAALKDVRF